MKSSVSSDLQVRSGPQADHAYMLVDPEQKQEKSMVRPFAALAALTAILLSTVAFPQRPIPGMAPIPDFSGMWARISFPGFEPPLAGPGPVTNLKRAPGGGPTVTAWVGDYTNPILKPEAADIVKRRGAIEASGVHAPSPRSYCWPGGVPFVLTNTGMQMFQQSDRITFIYSDDHEVRFVRMNGPHSMPLTPSWYGDSVAHYEGDTLVIDTVGIKIGPFAMVDVYGTPHTLALHVLERYRLLDYEAAKAAEERGAKENLSVPAGDTGLARDPDYKGKGLQLEFTVEDDGVFTTPWTATVTYRRPSGPLGQWPEFACAENPNAYDPTIWEKKPQCRARTSPISERRRQAA